MAVRLLSESERNEINKRAWERANAIEKRLKDALPVGERLPVTRTAIEKRTETTKAQTRTEKNMTEKVSFKNLILGSEPVKKGATDPAKGATFTIVSGVLVRGQLDMDLTAPTSEDATRTASPGPTVFPISRASLTDLSCRTTTMSSRGRSRSMSRPVARCPRHS